MRIQNYIHKRYTYTPKTNNHKSFRGETYTKNEYNKKRDATIVSTALVTLGLSCAATGIIATCEDSKNKKSNKEQEELFAKIINNPDIKQDKFRVEDLNNDNVPEIIFEKKDGTEIALDIKNKQFYNIENSIKLIKAEP